jgi:hypothetical protein
MGSGNEFYLGKLYDLKSKEILDQQVDYDPPDLTTHAIVTGMTGSGKTGLCVGLLEEAALQGIPALVIDPKGDLTNLVLSFPDLSPSDFEPWIDKNSVRRENKTIEQVAKTTAETWKKGLADWGLGKLEIEKLNGSVERTIFTPGSTTGKPVNIMASFDAPDLDWEENEEILREKTSSTVTALLTLIGMKDIDPLLSREHILLANIIEHHWQNKISLDLTTIIQEIQNPPFDQLGAFGLNDFFPKKDRMNLAILINNVLASPSFQSWIKGPPLDIESMLYTSDGKPRHSIFYLAHLDDVERMFFITLIYSAVETWMRKQRGTGDLRALVYFDEIHGYLPPVANPPSKPLIIRLLKTARAYGVGLILTTQNPIDIDYKAISNAGTWMIGRLQTDQDKQRLLDGLESAAGGIKRGDYDRLISALGKRVFLYHNVHEKKPEIFHTRWVMSYLAGPLTLSQIPALNDLAGTSLVQDTKSQKTGGASTPIRKTSEKSTSKDIGVPGDVKQYFYISNEAEKTATLSPSLIAVAKVRYLRQRPPVDFEKSIISVIKSPAQAGQNWKDGTQYFIQQSDISESAGKAFRFESVPDFMDSSTWWNSQEKDFEHWIYETDTISLRSSKLLGLTAGPEISETEFQKMCSDAVKTQMKEDLEKIGDQYQAKMKTVKDRIARQELKIEKYKGQLTSRRADTALKVGESLLNLVAKGKLSGVSSSSTKMRMSAEAKSRLKEAETILENYQEDLAILEKDFAEKKADAQQKWSDAVNNIDEMRVSPTKNNIRISQFGLLWRD